MKKAMLTVASNLVCIGLVGLVAITPLLMHQSVFAMSSTAGNNTSSNELETKGKIVITEKKGFLFEKKDSGEFALRKNAEKIPHQIGALSLDELKKKLKSDDYLERVWVYFYYRVKTNHKIYAELCQENEEGWDAVIEKLIVDLFLAYEEAGSAEVYRQMIMIILEGFDKKIVKYFEANMLSDYYDSDIRRSIMYILKRIAKKKPEIRGEIISIIKPLEKDSDKNVRETATRIIKEYQQLK